MSLLLFTTVWLQCLPNLMLRVFFSRLIINIWLLKMKVAHQWSNLQTNRKRMPALFGKAQ